MESLKKAYDSWPCGTFMVKMISSGKKLYFLLIVHGCVHGNKVHGNKVVWVEIAYASFHAVKVKLSIGRREGNTHFDGWGTLPFRTSLFISVQIKSLTHAYRGIYQLIDWMHWGMGSVRSANTGDNKINVWSGWLMPVFSLSMKLRGCIEWHKYQINWNCPPNCFTRCHHCLFFLFFCPFTSPPPPPWSKQSDHSLWAIQPPLLSPCFSASSPGYHALSLLLTSVIHTHFPPANDLFCSPGSPGLQSIWKTLQSFHFYQWPQIEADSITSQTS